MTSGFKKPLGDFCTRGKSVYGAQAWRLLEPGSVIGGVGPSSRHGM